MTLFLKNNLFYKLLILILALGFITASSVFADETSQTLSVSPTLIQVSVEPSQNWKSELRIFNVNNYDLEIFPQVVNFAPSGEAGQGEMIPLNESETYGKTLAEWINIATSSIIIPRQQSFTLPFSVNVPSDAAPGGHYAAILIGTKPPESNGASSRVKTSQFVTALLFTKVSGDVIEAGLIREFNTTNWLVSKPEVSFGLRFENTGNVHLQPQGDIQIYNMWGTERASIPINYQTHFGNVLPKSIRKFDFTWSAENNLTDIGRYKAIVTLGYGDESKKFVTSTTYFWLVPIKQLAILLFCTVLGLWFISFAIKLYIRRMLTLAGLNTNHHYRVGNDQINKQSSKYLSKNTVVIKNYKTVIAPVRTGVNDLFSDVKSANSFSDFIKKFMIFVKNYRYFFLFVILLIMLVIFLIFFFKSVHSINHPYNVIIENKSGNVSISSEQIYYNKLSPLEKVAPSDQIEDQTVKVDVINSSGILGVGAKVRLFLESYNYQINELDSALNRAEEKTVIIYNQDNQKEALSLSKILDGALISLDPATSVNELKIYVGQDLKNK